MSRDESSDDAKPAGAGQSTGSSSEPRIERQEGASDGAAAPSSSRPESAARAGAWLDALPERWLKLLAILAAGALVVFVIDRTASVVFPFLRQVLDILSPALVAFAIAYLLDPVVDWFEERGRSRHFGIAVVGLGGVVLVGVALLFVIPTVVEQVQNLGPKVAVYFERATDRLEELPIVSEYAGEDWSEAIQRARNMAAERLGDVDWTSIVPSVGRWLGSVAASGYGAVVAALNLLLIPILAVYLLRDIDVIKERIVDLVPPARRESLLGPMREIDSALSGFVRGQLLVAACLSVLYMLGLWLSGTPLGITIGLFAGAVSFIPYLGLVLGLVPALALNFLEHGDLPHLIGVVATFAIAQFLEGSVITPKIVGDSVGLHPVLVILAVIAGGTFFGLAGMLLAIPALAAAMVVVRRANERYRATDFYRTGRPPEPDT